MPPNYLLLGKRIIEKLVIISITASLFAFTNKESSDFAGVSLRDTIPRSEIFKLKRKDIYVVIFDNDIAKIRVKSGDSIVMNANDFDSLPPVVQKEISPNGDGVYTNEQIESKFPGGQAGWGLYLMKNLKYPAEALNNNIVGTVVVQFIIDENGRVKNVEVVSGPTSGGLREEAIRIIKASGKWEPAIWNGYKVTSYKKQPLSFGREASKQ